MLQQIGPRHHAALVTQQVFEQRKLAGGELNELAGALHALGPGVEAEVGEVEQGLGRGGFGATADQGAQTGQQLFKGKGLDQVVVGPSVEAADFVVGFAQRREHEDGHAGVVGAHLAAHFQPAEAGQHLVQNQAVVVRGLGPAQAQQAVGGQVHGVVLLGEPLVQEGRHGGLVFN